MGTIKKGILGGFSGKVGTVIGASWRGIDYMRSLPKKSSKAASQAQVNTRNRFLLVTSFLRPISSLIAIGYQSYKSGITPLNAAIAYHLKEAVTGTAPNYTIALPKFIYSRGELMGANTPKATAVTGAKLDFSWLADGANMLLSGDKDKVILVVYNPVKQRFVLLTDAAERSALKAELQLPADFIGDGVHCYMSFVSADGKSVSTNNYVGLQTIV
jgi:hypothetical protein